MLPGLVTCSRRASVTFFLCPEESVGVFASGNMTVFSRVWRSETIFAGCLLMHPFFIRCYRLFSEEIGCRWGKMDILLGNVGTLDLFCTIIS